MSTFELGSAGFFAGEQTEGISKEVNDIALKLISEAQRLPEQLKVNISQLTHDLEVSGHLPVMQFMGFGEAAKHEKGLPDQTFQSDARASLDRDYFGRITGVHTATYDRTIEYDLFGTVSEVVTVDRETGKREVIRSNWNGLIDKESHKQIDPVTGRVLKQYHHVIVNDDGTLSYLHGSRYGHDGKTTRQYHDGRTVTTTREEYSRRALGVKETYPDGTSVESDEKNRVVSTTVLRDGKPVQIDYKYDERGLSEMKYTNADGTKETWRQESSGWVKYDKDGRVAAKRSISSVAVAPDGSMSYSENGMRVVEYRNGSTRISR